MSDGDLEQMTGVEPGAPEDEAVAVEAAQDDDSRRKLAFLIAAIVVAVVVWWLISHIALVPNTMGMSATRARSLLKFAGFETSATLVPAQDSLAGRVVMQSPAKGLYLTWWPVQIAVGSSGLAGAGQNDVRFVIVPGTGALDLSGVTTQTAEVMPTDPEEVLALYLPPRTWAMIMPDVQNMTLAQARSALRTVGMTLSTKTGPSTTDVAAGRIYYQRPAPGVAIHSGQAATLWVSDGPFNVVSGKDSGVYPRPPYHKGE